jgi:hypothetical protein
VRVPTTADTVAAASFATPSPGVVKQMTDVDDAHAAVAQLDMPSRDDGVASSEPKSSPDTVTLHPVVDAALASPTKLTTGAGGPPRPRYTHSHASTFKNHTLLRQKKTRINTLVAAD